MSDTETESETEFSVDDEGFLRDDEVFIGPVSTEELRVNRKIGGFRRTTVASRFSSVGSSFELDEKDSLDDSCEITINMDEIVKAKEVEDLEIKRQQREIFDLKKKEIKDTIARIQKIQMEQRIEMQTKIRNIQSNAGENMLSILSTARNDIMDNLSNTIKNSLLAFDDPLVTSLNVNLSNKELVLLASKADKLVAGNLESPCLQDLLNEKANLLKHSGQHTFCKNFLINVC